MATGVWRIGFCRAAACSSALHDSQRWRGECSDLRAASSSLPIAGADTLPTVLIGQALLGQRPLMGQSE